MIQKLRISLIAEGYEHTAELSSDEFISLNENTFQWLKQAFMGIGYNPKCVGEFFNKSITLPTDESTS